MKNTILLVAITLLNIQFHIFSQNTSKEGTTFSLQLNSITTAVPFLRISPESRGGAMGDIGIATSPDANSNHWNPSKIAFSEEDFELNFGYTPWLQSLGIKDINLFYLGGLYKLNNNSGLGASFKYFSLGEITFKNDNNEFLKNYKPNELSIDVSYNRRLAERFSMGISLRYIQSSLTGGLSIDNTETKSGRSVATDISGFYKTKKFKIGEKESNLNLGFNVSNIGAKMSYSTSQNTDFLPTNLGIGSSLMIKYDNYNKININFDINKLLVPTKPEIINGVIVSGKNNDVGVLEGMIQSFYDAPGYVLVNNSGDFFEVQNGTKFREEIREINPSIGIEYIYNEQLAIRTGYFHEHYTKGNRRFITIGAGIKYAFFNIDASYLLSVTNNSPLKNTFRISLGTNLKNPKTENKPKQ